MTTTIQGTSKNLKGALLLGAFLIVIGIILALTMGNPRLLWISGVGIVCRVITKFLIWWNHA